LDKIRIIWVNFNNLNEIWVNWDNFIQIWVSEARNVAINWKNLAKFQQTFGKIPTASTIFGN